MSTIKNRSKPEIFRIVVLGEGGVGKTAITLQLCLNHFLETYDPTIEDLFRKQTVVDGKTCILEILDTAGQEVYTGLQDQWIRDGNGFLIVYSITNRESFEKMAEYKELICRIQESEDIPIVLIGNKADQSSERVVNNSEGLSLAKSLNIPFLETSAKTSLNIDDAFSRIVRDIRNFRDPEIGNSNGKIPHAHSSSFSIHHRKKSCSLM